VLKRVTSSKLLNFITDGMQKGKLERSGRRAQGHWLSLGVPGSEPTSCFSFFSGVSSGAGDQHLASKGVEGLSVTIFLSPGVRAFVWRPRKPDWKSEILRLPSKWLGKSKPELCHCWSFAQPHFCIRVLSFWEKKWQNASILSECAPWLNMLQFFTVLISKTKPA
jgi:hypothetical protein